MLQRKNYLCAVFRNKTCVWKTPAWNMYDITCELHSSKGRVNLVNPAVQLKKKCK